MDGSPQTAEENPPQPRYRARGEGSVVSGSAPNALSLGPRDVLAGRLVFEGDVRVQGTMEGETTLSGDLQVDTHGTVKARVQARNVNVRGTLEGEVTARERLLISGTGNVSGTVKVARLAVEDGALLNGTITMERPSPSSNGRAPGEG
jgi:cytoskeletal protein CcmA (bactofilin family)